MFKRLESIPMAVFAGFLQIALGYLILVDKTQVGPRFEKSLGIDKAILAALLIGGGVALVTIIRSQDVLFTIATVPYVIYVLTTARVVIQIKGGESVLFIYIFSLVMLYVLYGKENGAHG